MENWLEELVVPFDNAAVGAVGGAILPFNEKSLISEYLGVSLFMRYPRYGKRKQVKGFPSCNLAVRKTLTENGFDTNVFTTYGGEDKDICFRVIERGYRVVFEPKARIRHKHPENLRDLFSLFIKSSKGRVLFGKKYPKAPDILVFNLHLPSAYITAAVLASIAFGWEGFLLSSLPAFFYVLRNSVTAYTESGKFFLCFAVKPFFDILSALVIYFVYTYNRLRSFAKNTEV